MATARVPIFYSRVGKVNSAGHLRVAVKADKYWKTVVLLYIILLVVREAEFVYGPKRIFANGPAI